MQVIVDNLLTNYQLQGKGKLVLWLHGWGDNLLSSEAFRSQLAQQYQVLAIDLPGFGKTQAPPEAWSLDNYTYYVAHVLAKLKLAQPYAVLGHSNGGAVTIRAVTLKTLQPQKIVLLASAGIRNGKSVRRALLQLLAKAGNLATIGLPERYRRTLRRQLYKSAGSDMLVVESMQDTFKKTVRQDVQADAAELQLPALLIFGENDKAVPPYMAQRYEQLISGSQLRMVEAGHFVYLDQPAQTAQLITEFLGA